MNRQATTAAIVAVAVIVVAVLLFYLWPSTTVPPEDGAPQVTDAERGDSAREVIAELQNEGSADYDEAFARAQTFQSEGRLADAQLLYFFAARGGHAASAFELASANDPNHHSPEASLLPEPDPFQAYRWYAEALEGGMTAAAERLDALHEWAEREAQAGSTQAEQLLLQWD